MIVLSAAARSAPIYHHSPISLCQSGISSGHSKPRTTILKYARVTLIPAESIIEIFHLSDSSILANQPRSRRENAFNHRKFAKKWPSSCLLEKCSHDYWLPMTGTCFYLIHNQQPVTRLSKVLPPGPLMTFCD